MKLGDLDREPAAEESITTQGAGRHELCRSSTIWETSPAYLTAC
jgi:hypothetical protein